MDRYKEYSSIETIDGIKFVHGLVHNEINYSGDITVHEIQTGETLDSISYTYYNSPEFWWVIAWYNNIINPFCGFKSDRTLDIPVNITEILNNIS